MRINKYSEVFVKGDFLKDKYDYNVFEDMLSSPENFFMSDQKNYIIGRGNRGYPIWIWTKDNIEEEKVNELENILRKEYLLDSKNNITCKKELFPYLNKDFPNNSDYHEIASLICKELKPVELSIGYIDRANYGDKTLLANYWIANCEEIYKDKKVSFQESLVEVDSWIKNDNFFVWRNGTGKAVSIASVNIINNEAIISHVFTPKEERKKGYCKSLIHEITKEILDNKLIPLLYTDHQYKISNHTYSNLGYVERCVLINININKIK